MTTHLGPTPGPHDPSTATLLVAVDGRARDHAAAEHQLHLVESALGAHAWDPASWVASTHVVEGHVALVVSATGPDPVGARTAARLARVVDGADVLTPEGAGADGGHGGLGEALRHHRDRTWGRLARFPGQDLVGGRVRVAELVARTCVDEVTALAGTEITPETVLDLGDFVRPQWRDGRCSVLVQQASWGLIPFEVREQQACCSAH